MKSFQLQEDDPISTGICKSCAISLQDFHEFYVSIENVQTLLKAKASCYNSFHRKEVDGYKQEALDKINEIGEIPFICPKDLSDNSVINEGHQEMKDALSDSASDNDNIKYSNLNKYSSLERTNLPEKEKINEIVSTEGERSLILKKNSFCVDYDEGKQKLHNENSQSKARSSTTVKMAIATKKRGRPNKHEDSKNSLKIAKESANYKAKIKEYDTEIAQFMTLYCDFCNKSSENFPALRRHMRDEHNIKDGYVSCCNKKFTKRALLLYHIRQHLNPSYYRYAFV